jgi:hypothetical protein
LLSDKRSKIVVITIRQPLKLRHGAARRKNTHPTVDRILDVGRIHSPLNTPDIELGIPVARRITQGGI